MKRKIIIPIISFILLIIIIIVVLLLHNNDNNKNNKTKETKLNIKTEKALGIITSNDTSIKKEDLEYVGQDKDEKYVFKVPNEETYYYVDLKTQTFIYSEY